MSAHDTTPALSAESTAAGGTPTRGHTSTTGTATSTTESNPTSGRRETREIQTTSREDGEGMKTESPKLARTPSIHPMERLVTTSAVAAAMAEVHGRDLAARRRRPSGEATVLANEADTASGIPEVAASQATIQRRSTSISEGVKNGEPSSLESIKRTLDAEEGSQLKRNVSVSHISGIRERLSKGNVGRGNPGAFKRTPSASMTPTLKRTSSSSTSTSPVKRTSSSSTPTSPTKHTPSANGPAMTFFAVAKAVAASTTLVAHSGASSAAADSERADQSQHYKQMMERFQLRRLEHSGSGRGPSMEAPPIMRRGSARVLPVESDLSRRHSIDAMTVFARRRSEGEQRQESSADFSVRSRPVSEHENIQESPRRPGAPSFLPEVSTVKLVTTAEAASEARGGLTDTGTSNEANANTATTKSEVVLPLLALPGSVEPHANEHDPSTAKTRRQSSSPRRSVVQPIPDGPSNPRLPHIRPLIKRGAPPSRMLPSWRRKTRRLVARLSAPLSPFSWTARFRSSILLLAFCVHALGFPYEAAFHNSGHASFLIVDAVTEMVYVLDFLLTFNTSFVNKRGVLVASRQLIAWNFLTGEFFPQLLAALPITTLMIGMNGFEAASHSHDEEITAIGSVHERFVHVLLDIFLRSHRIVHIMHLFQDLGRVRAARSGRSVWSWLLYSRYSHLVRIIWIVGAVMLIAHNVTCSWYLLLQDDSGVSSTMLCGIISGSRSADSVAGSELGEYAACFYESMQMLQGQGLLTRTIGQHVFASFVLLLGSIVLAVIFGNVAMLVANFNANSTAYQRKMESVFAGMTKMQLPPSLRERIHQYYAHLWREYEALDGAPLARFAKELTHNLTLEVVLFKYMELVMNVPFWEHCSPDFQKQLVLSLDTRVYMPDDFLMRRGEVGDEFYMINRGICELVGGRDTTEHATEPLARRLERQGEDNQDQGDTSTLFLTCYDSAYAPEHFDAGTESDTFRPTGRQAVDTRGNTISGGTRTPYTWTEVMKRGQAFGELALLMNYQRTANVRAVTYVETCVLSRDAFQAILTRYPADRKHVIAQILIATLENNERYGVPCPLTAMVRSVFEEEEDIKVEGDHRISARRAAKIIASAVNPNLEDDSIKFAVGPKLKEQLTAVRDQEFGVIPDSSIVGSETSTPREKTQSTVGYSPAVPSGSTSSLTRQRPQMGEGGCSCECRCQEVNDVDTKNTRNATSASAVDPEAESRLQQLESAQVETLVLIQELQRGVQEGIEPLRATEGDSPDQEQSQHGLDSRRKSFSRADSAPSSEQSSREAAADKALGSQLRGRLASAGNPSIGPTTQRRPSFLRVRSSTAPLLSDLETQGMLTNSNAPVDAQPSDAINRSVASRDVNKSVAAKYQPVQRSMTMKLLRTPEGSRPLRLPPSAAAASHSATKRAGSGSQRFIQRVTSQFTGLTSQGAGTQASPTQYADRLFQSVQERNATARETDHDESTNHEDCDHHGIGSGP